MTGSMELRRRQKELERCNGVRGRGERRLRGFNEAAGGQKEFDRCSGLTQVARLSENAASL